MSTTMSKAFDWKQSMFAIFFFCGKNTHCNYIHILKLFC